MARIVLREFLSNNICNKIDNFIEGKEKNNKVSPELQDAMNDKEILLDIIKELLEENARLNLLNKKYSKELVMNLEDVIKAVIQEQFVSIPKIDREESKQIKETVNNYYSKIKYMIDNN